MRPSERDRSHRPCARALAALLVLACALVLAPAATSSASARDSDPGPPRDKLDVAAPDPRGDASERHWSGGRRFVPGEVIVGFEPGVSAARRAALRGSAGAALAERLEAPRAELLEIRDDDRSPVAVARLLERLPGVAWAQPNHYRRASEVIPDDPLLSSLWGLRNAGQLVRRQTGASGADIGATRAWEVTTGSDEIVVAVVDTGIDASHPDLAANVVPGRNFVGSNPANTTDRNGHGTHVAGTIGAIGDNGAGVAGVAWEVGLMPVRVLNANGVGTDTAIADGFAHAVDAGAEIVNASLGGEDAAPLIDAVIDSAPQTLFVVAAGNGGDDGVGDDNDAEPAFPCAHPGPNVICVAATDSRDSLAEFSNFGQASVDLAAPGVDIESTAAAGVDREYFFDGFEKELAGRWVAGGPANKWARVDAPRSTGDWSLADSPGQSYSPDTNAFVDGPPIDLTGASLCELSYWMDLDIPDSQGDAIVVEGSPNGIDWSFLDPPGWLGTATGFFFHDASALDGRAQGRISFRMLSDSDGIVGGGVHIDDVSILCRGAGHGYDSLSGTSMAAPHVAGAAALVLAEHPEASLAQLRAAILGSVDELAALDGVVASGGRLNAEAAVLAVPPRARIAAGPSGWIRDRRPVFELSQSKPGELECSLVAAGAPRAFEPCASPFQPADPLADRRWELAVRASNEHGPGSTARRVFNVDNRPPSTRFTRAPAPRSNQRQARFAFRADEPGARFQCRLDALPWRNCASPQRRRVAPGAHVFRVRATDRAGNRGRPATHRFRVLR